MLRSVPYDSFMLWSSRPAIVVGKHQNTLSEINFPYVYNNQIDVARRLSGGGTVFHGPGNLNFTFVRTGEEGRLIDFRRHTAPVIGFLNSLGIPARFEGKNDIRVDGLKVSGNAEHVYKNRVLHHGTLLYDADLTLLNEAIRVQPGRYKDKSVQSVRSRVANISSFMDDPPPFYDFVNKLQKWLKNYLGDETGRGSYDIIDHVLDQDELEKVQQLANEKYRRWEWNFGYSTDYIFTGSSLIDGRQLNIRLLVKKGVINEASLFESVSKLDSKSALYGNSELEGKMKLDDNSELGGNLDLGENGELDGNEELNSNSDKNWRALIGGLPGCRHHAGDILLLLQHNGLADNHTNSFPKELFPLFF